MVNFMDFYYTGPGTLAGRYMENFGIRFCRAEDLQPGWAKPIKIMGEAIHPLPRRRRQTPRRRLSLRAPPNPTFGRLGRGRLHSLPLSRLEVR
mgnify:CR=1 FL=1